MPAAGVPLYTIQRVIEVCDHLLPDGSTWPTATDRACLWCTEPFPWVPVGVPRAYNERKDIFTLKWAFCSFNCAKAYMCDKGMKTDLLFYLAQRLFGGKHETAVRLTGIREAPARESLQKFGGPLTIDQFRNTPMRIKEGLPLMPSVRGDPHLLTYSGGAVGEAPDLAQPSRNVRACSLIPPTGSAEPVTETTAKTKTPASKGRGSVSAMMQRTTAPPKPAVRKGLDAFLRPTGAAPRQQLAASQASRPSKRAKS